MENKRKRGGLPGYVVRGSLIKNRARRPCFRLLCQKGVCGCVSLVLVLSPSFATTGISLLLHTSVTSHLSLPTCVHRRKEVKLSPLF